MVITKYIIFFNDFQYGFGSFCLTEDLLIVLSDKLGTAFNMSSTTWAVSRNTLKRFDRVSSQIDRFLQNSVTDSFRWYLTECYCKSVRLMPVLFRVPFLLLFLSTILDDLRDGTFWNTVIYADNANIYWTVLEYLIYDNCSS